jgi:hypothetical protein
MRKVTRHVIRLNKSVNKGGPGFIQTRSSAVAAVRLFVSLNSDTPQKTREDLLDLVKQK